MPGCSCENRSGAAVVIAGDERLPLSHLGDRIASTESWFTSWLDFMKATIEIDDELYRQSKRPPPFEGARSRIWLPKACAPSFALLIRILAPGGSNCRSSSRKSREPCASATKRLRKLKRVWTWDMSLSLANWFAMASLRTPAPKRWMDAYLCAFARSVGAVLVTFDCGSLPFEGDALKITLLA